MKQKIKFFKEAVKNYKTSGTVIPSSQYLAKRMLKRIDFNEAKVIVELGPGDGVITKEIINNLEKDTYLVCFEINEAFYHELLKLQSDKVIILNKSAEEISEALVMLNLPQADYIISSLPLTIIPKQISEMILENSYKALANDGRFIQYQYSLTYFKKLKEVFDIVRLEFEPFNFPPAFVYRCVKTDFLEK